MGHRAVCCSALSFYCQNHPLLPLPACAQHCALLWACLTVQQEGQGQVWLCEEQVAEPRRVLCVKEMAIQGMNSLLPAQHSVALSLRFRYNCKRKVKGPQRERKNGRERGIANNITTWEFKLWSFPE